jgi:hypothetical protein
MVNASWTARPPDPRCQSRFWQRSPRYCQPKPRRLSPAGFVVFGSLPPWCSALCRPYFRGWDRGSAASLPSPSPFSGLAARRRGAARPGPARTAKLEILAARRGVLTSAQTAGAKLFRIREQRTHAYSESSERMLIMTRIERYMVISPPSSELEWPLTPDVIRISDHPDGSVSCKFTAA